MLSTQSNRTLIGTVKDLNVHYGLRNKDGYKVMVAIEIDLLSFTPLQDPAERGYLNKLVGKVLTIEVTDLDRDIEQGGTYLSNIEIGNKFQVNFVFSKNRKKKAHSFKLGQLISKKKDDSLQ